MVVVVELERRLGDGAVVGEGGPAADRHARAAALHALELVHPQHVHRGVDRVLVAARVLRPPCPGPVEQDAVVGQVGLDAAVAGEPEDPRRPPAGRRRGEVIVGAPDRGGDLVGQEGVELRVGGFGIEQPVEADRVGGRLQARGRGVEGREVGVAARPRVGVRGRDQHVLLAEAAVGVERRHLLLHAGRDHEQVHLHERDLAAAPLQHQRARVQARVLAGDAVGARPAAQVVARSAG